ncbi:unnamed protein product [Brassica oleracea var. botrytis]
MFNLVFQFFNCILPIFYFFLYLILKCKTIFYATCHFSGEFFFADVDALWSLKRSLLLV